MGGISGRGTVEREELSGEKRAYLAKAYVMRLEVVMIEVVAKRRQSNGNLFSFSFC